MNIINSVVIGSNNTNLINRKRNRVISAELRLTNPNDHEEVGIVQLMTQEKQQQQQQQHQQPANKRRKGVAGAILSTALDAALFTSAIGYAAYQFWCGKTLEDEQLNTFISHSPKANLTKPTNNTPPNIHQIPSSPPPPPYEPRQAQQNMPPQPPPRRPRLRSTLSRLNSSSRTTTGPTTESDINFILRPIPNPTSSTLLPRDIPKQHPLRRNKTQIDDDLMTDFVCSLKPYIPHSSSPETNKDQEDEDDNDDDDDDEDDPEMKAFKTQIQDLIIQGQAALASRPPRLLPHPPSSSSSQADAQNGSDHPDHPQIINQPSSHLDPNLSLLQQALDKAASKPATNWWEQ